MIGGGGGDGGGDGVRTRLMISLPSSSSGSSGYGEGRRIMKELRISDLLLVGGEGGVVIDDDVRVDRDVGIRALFASMEEGQLHDDMNDIEDLAMIRRRRRRHYESEIVDMVDTNGRVLGSLPRSYVHEYNILHRGVGILVTRGDSMKSFDGVVGRVGSGSIGGRAMPMVYVHRRTSTKRIFPDLYDMFVGGLSCRGESSRSTAAREVAEELGLRRGLDFVVDGDDGGERGQSSSMIGGGRRVDDVDPLSDELFKCVVRTSYNRCVVSVFAYHVAMTNDDDGDGVEEEAVSWQDEEVAWGDYVPYDIVEMAANASMKRLVERGAWPPDDGMDDDDRPVGDDAVVSALDFNHDHLAPPDGASTAMERHEYDNDDDISTWKTWDFVPDGLLVWEAWKSFIRRR
ncbi:hypothetical protein ACHAXA_003430 [Cyclostephanos tholiformis]|uniref:Nudix hydrolase domain-containing protein n=1 Tax=Cyclostephanos tholiformis TaxID=382380 RepID=A0ABD3SG55_9STRA